MSSDDNTILTVPQVVARLGIARATFYNEAARNPPHWPQKIQLTAGRVGYLARDVDRYLAAQQNPDAWRNHCNANGRIAFKRRTPGNCAAAAGR